VCSSLLFIVSDGGFFLDVPLCPFFLPDFLFLLFVSGFAKGGFVPEGLEGAKGLK
jgi:hypothetical protein